jgi:mxaJ protein
MCSAFSNATASARMRVLALALALMAALAAARSSPAASAAILASPDTPLALRVCADPNNLPFSDAHGAGFEDRLALLLARELGRELVMVWQPQRRGFTRLTLDADRCDAWMGVPASFDRVLTTRPYYRSSYVFVSRTGLSPPRSFDDPRLQRLRVGIQITGEDYENPPPAQALASRGLGSQVRGFTVYGDYSRPSPHRAVVDAVAQGEVDVAAVWGPVGGYFAARHAPRLAVTPIHPSVDRSGVPMTFAIAVGVRRNDLALREVIDAALARRARDIDALLRQFSVPLVPLIDPMRASEVTR